MRPKIKHIVKSQVESGVSPSPDNVYVAEAFRTFNEIGSGVDVGLDDLSFMDLRLVSVIESVKNDVRQSKLEEAKRDAGRY